MVEIVPRNPQVIIEVDNVGFEFIMWIPGENLPQRFLGVDECIRVLRSRLQTLRYDMVEEPHEDEIAGRANLDVMA
jgi:hypothetical protein